VCLSGARAVGDHSKWSVSVVCRSAWYVDWKRGGGGVTRIQHVLFALDADYFGHPYYSTGHALVTALGRRVEDRVRRALCVSHGVFLPGEYMGSAWHSASGGAAIADSLPSIESYEDLFIFRDPAQRWLLDSRPRDAHNTHDVQSHGGRVTFASSCFFGRPPEVRASKRSVQWYVHCYLHSTDEERAVVPIPEEILDGVRVGGGRNYGLGELRLVDTQTVALDSLDYSRLVEAGTDEYVIELISPYVLQTAYPGADDQSVPWWWDRSGSGVTASTVADTEDRGLRRREERLVVGTDVYELDTIDHGQVVGYAGDSPVETARNGVLRVGSHDKYGFGEFRVRPADDDRVANRMHDESPAQGRHGSDRGERTGVNKQ
jgi:hypothetical protein